MTRCHTFQGDDGAFDVSTFGAPSGAGSVLFAAGGGGDPGRYDGLLEHLAAADLFVVAPHFPRLVSPRVSAELVEARACRLDLAWQALVEPLRGPCFAVGHSLGAALLLALAGARLWMDASGPLVLPTLPLKRLALLSPALDFFRAPGALHDVRASLAVWSGQLDTITPSASVDIVRQGLPDRSKLLAYEVAEANHFTFMDRPPPHTQECHPNAQAFRAGLARDVLRCLVGHGPHASGGRA